LNRSSLVLALVVLGPAALARGDVGPKPRMYAPGMETRPGDLPGIEIEMTAEDVSVTLVANENRSEKLEVEATFDMTNLGDAVELEEGFPVGPVANMDPFSIELDGKKVAADLVDIVSGKKVEPGTKLDPEGKHDFWYVWKAAYKAKSRCAHKVKYTVSYSHPFYTMVDTAYVLHTGARWKGPIGRAKVTFKVQGMDPEKVYSVSPRKGLSFEGGA
jgi:hypothetical protein